MGARQLRKIQLGKEVTPGTGVAATTLWRGTGALKDDSVVAFANEDVGILSNTDRSYIPQLQSSLALQPVEATFEQLPYLFEGGIKKVGTGAADGTGSDKVYTYPMSSTTQNTIQTFSIEGGDNAGAERMLYSIVTDITLSGQIFKPVMMSANVLARGTAPFTFTPALTPILVDTIILFGTGKLFLDAIGGVIGTTQISGSLRGMNLKIKTGVEILPSVENLFFTSHAIVDPVITGDLVFYWDSNAIAEKANWLNQVARLMQLKFEGPLVTTPGTTYSKKTLLANLYGVKWTKFSELQEQTGHDLVTASFECKYDLTSANFASFTVVNEVTALP